MERAMSITLERQIAVALADDVNSADVAALIEETEAAIAQADATAEAERVRALDPALSPDPVKAREAMQAAEFARDRLHLQLPRLGARLAQVEAAERLAQWHVEGSALKARRDALVVELAEVYPRVVDQLVDLFTRATAVDEEIARLGVSPDGRSAVPPVGGAGVAERLKLPAWGGSGEWPPRRQLDPAWFAPVPFNPRYSADWAVVMEAETAALREQREREDAEREAKALANYHGPRWWEGERA
jgi:hypothetical protein